MTKFIPYEKLPRKKQQELDRQRRGSWNGVNPVTRKPENSKVYNRNKAQRWRKDNGDALFIYLEKYGELVGFLHFSQGLRRCLCPSNPLHLFGVRFTPVLSSLGLEMESAGCSAFILTGKRCECTV